MPEEPAQDADQETRPMDIGSDTPGVAAAAEAAAGPAGADEVESLRAGIAALTRRAEEAQDRVLRAQAELDNLRKRTARDVENAHRYALERFVGDLLPVMDSLELGIDAAASAEDVAGLRQGMDLTRKMFQDTLARFGVTAVDPAGEKFNPERHQAVSVQQIEGREPGTVVAVMQKGYELNGRLVRPAMVVVSK
jgi:molecular chaperone GrpE